MLFFLVAGKNGTSLTFHWEHAAQLTLKTTT